MILSKYLETNSKESVKGKTVTITYPKARKPLALAMGRKCNTLALLASTD